MKKKKEKKVEVKEEMKEKKVEVKVETKKEIKKETRTLGKSKFAIDSVTKREVNGRMYNNITTKNGITFLLSDRDFEAQVSN